MRLLRSPLIHFLLIGAAIFALYGTTDNLRGSEPGARIIVTAGEVARLRSLWERQWHRAPTAEELRRLIDEQVREEVLYREALALGLDRDDTVIRRRLTQKFEFLTEDLAAPRDPDPAEVLDYFRANRERYRIPSRLSFVQVYFNLDRRGTAARHDAELAVVSLRSGSAGANIAELGDGFMLDHTYVRKTEQDIEAVFGGDFTHAVLRLDPGVWSGPIASGYGLHLVRVDEHIAGRLPALSEVEEQVHEDWSYDQRRRANEAIFERLLARYDVAIEEDAPTSAAEDDLANDPEAEQ
jgi:hypothetical protein